MQLRGYQLTGAHFLATKGRALLADEPGVGKTAQALAACSYLQARSILVVCPKSAAGVWLDEAKTWLGINDTNVYMGTRRSIKGIPALTVTNYTVMGELFKGRQWDVIIFDESHKLKNRKTKMYRTAKTAHASYIFMLTGSPISHGAHDLWTSLDILRPTRFGSFWKFATKYTNAYRDEYGWHVEGVKNEEELYADLSPIVLRRRKADVLTELPPKTRQFIPLTLDPKQRALYDELKEDLVAETEGGGVLLIDGALSLSLRLRQLLVHPAILGFDVPSATLEALVEDLKDTQPEAVVIFTPFVRAFPLIADAVTNLGYQWTDIRGGLTGESMADRIRWFQEGTRRQVLVASVGVATSWTAHRAQTSYHLGFDWDPSVNVQAEDRLHRLGQRGNVLNKYFVHPGTIDTHVRDILERKTTYARLVLDPTTLFDGVKQWR